MGDSISFSANINDHRELSYRILCPEKTETLEALERAYKLSKSNNLVYYFMTCILTRLSEHYKDVVGKFILKHKYELLEELSKIKKARHTLKHIRNAFDSNGINYVFIKTYRNITYAPDDIDILINVKQIQKAIRILKRNNFKVINYNNVEIRAYKTNFTRIDLYTAFIYMSRRLKIEELVLQNTRKVKFLGESILVPVEKYDFITLAMHAILGHRMINLLDFLYLDEILSKVNINDIVQISRDDETLIRCMLVYLKNHLYLRKTLLQKKYSSDLFPYLFSTKDVLQTLGNINLREKINYMVSHIIDEAYYAYKKSNINVPQSLKNLIQKLLFMHRSLIGDRHIANY